MMTYKYLKIYSLRGREFVLTVYEFINFSTGHWFEIKMVRVCANVPFAVMNQANIYKPCTINID
jgi:hypothetical protein